MFNRKFKLLVPITLALATGSAEVNAGLIGAGSALENITVFSNTYTTTGDAAEVYGSMLVGDVVTTGANAAVYGDVESVNAANIGGGVSTVATDPAKTFLSGGDVTSGGVLTVGGAASSPGPLIDGNITSAGAATIGAYAQVLGNMRSGGIATIGANSDVFGDLDGDSVVISASANVAGNTSSTPGGGVSSTLKADLEAKRVAAASQVNTIRATLDILADTTSVVLTPVIGDLTLVAGVYSAASLSTTASTEILLDAQGKDDQEWIFNIADILAIGAYHEIKIINDGANNNSSVFWNIGGTPGGGYASIGANARFIGSIFAVDYVSVGADTWMTSAGKNTCSGIYSETSYVSTGAKAVIDGNVCKTGIINPPPEQVSEPFGILLSGLAALGFVTRRKIRAARAS